jgi:hypothetical protein
MEPTEKHHADANKLLKRLQMDPAKLRIYGAKNLDDVQVFSISDASWGSPDLPQAGTATLVAEIESEDASWIHLHRCVCVAASSRRLRRVCRSTFAAELRSSMDSLDGALLDKMFLQECLGRKLQHHHFSDCHSLVSCVSSRNPQTTEKRLLLDIHALQEMMQDGHIHTFRHISAHHNPVDELTKHHAATKPSMLREFMKTNKMKFSFQSRAEVAADALLERENAVASDTYLTEMAEQLKTLTHEAQDCASF